MWAGAILNLGYSGTSSPTISQSTFSGNSASYSGGAIFSGGDSCGTSSPTISRSTFSGNAAINSGGAIYNSGSFFGTSSPTISQSTFSENSASTGGAIFNSGYSSGTSSPAIRFVTFSGNRANGADGRGGAIYTTGSAAQPTVDYAIFWGNTPPNGPQAYSEGSATLAVTNSLIPGACASDGSFGPSGATCAGEIRTADPQLGPLQDNGGPTHTLLPTAGITGGAVDAVACPASSGSDQRGVARPQGAMCDLGAVELRQGTHSLSVSVSVNGQGSVSGGQGACASTTSTCSADYVGEAAPLSVTLTANPAAGHSFTGWGGACSGSAVSCTVTMDQVRNVTATFSLLQATPVPTLGQWTLMGLGLLAAGLGMRRLRRA